MTITEPGLRRKGGDPAPRRRGPDGNRIFRGISAGAAAGIVLLLGAVFLFLLNGSWGALTAEPGAVEGGVDFTRGRSFFAYAGVTVFGTLLISLIALVLAVPMAIGIALFISHYAPRRLSQALGYLVDLLAAIPSVIFGLWGMATLEPLLRPFFAGVSGALGPVLGFISGRPAAGGGWDGGLPGFSHLARNLEWWPLRADVLTFIPPARNALMGGVVLAIMILPIITSLCREVFLRTPPLLQEAALGLGSTRWEMIRMTVLPLGRSGIVSAAMLGLGRALGETMALLMVLSPGLALNFRLLAPGQHSTIASQIALKFPESSGLESDVLIAVGFVLFGLTFCVNALARGIVRRAAAKEGAR